MAVTHSNKFLLLLVRSAGDVPRACREVGDFLAFQRSRLPTAHVEQDRRLIGIWVDPLMVETPPDVFGRASVSGQHQFRIRESVGVGGIWQLCSLDTDLAGEPADLGSIHGSVVSALIGEQPLFQHPQTQQFAPVFDADDRCSLIHLLSERLRERFPALIGEPVTWNRTTGALATLAGADERDRPH